MTAPRRGFITPAAIALLVAALGNAAPVLAQTPDDDARLSLPQALLQPAGKTRLKVWGFDIYDARLWVAPGFSATNFASHSLALELAYLRDFSAVDIADRSLKEMARSATLTQAQVRQWREAMLKVFPDVKKGDRITGVHKPGTGATFWLNGKRVGTVADAEFAPLFFGIWLSGKTSEPAMRAELLAGANP